MRSAVPAPLACIAELLRCPACLSPLATGQGSLTCERRHTYDLARPGYVTLLPSGRRCPIGDDGDMVAARAAIQDAGHFEPLTTALAEMAGSLGAPGTSVILDAGAGTARHLAGVLAALPGALGVAVDISRAASRRAARAHQRIAAVRANIWQGIPLRDATVDLAMSVFAPRNADELARVVRPGGVAIVATPSAEHLHELATLHTIRIDPAKPMRLQRMFAAWSRVDCVHRISWVLWLSHRDVVRMLAMGPTALHLRPDFRARLTALTEPVRLTAAVELRMLRRPEHLRL